MQAKKIKNEENKNDTNNNSNKNQKKTKKKCKILSGVYMPEKNYFCDIRVINHNNSNEKESIKNLDLHIVFHFDFYW